MDNSISLAVALHMATAEYTKFPKINDELWLILTPLLCMLFHVWPQDIFLSLDTSLIKLYYSSPVWYISQLSMNVNS